MKEKNTSFFLTYLLVMIILTLNVSDLTIVRYSEAKQSPMPKIHDIGMMTPAASITFIGNGFFYFNNGINSYFSPMVTKGFPKLKRNYFLFTTFGSCLEGIILILIYVRTVSIKLIVIVQKHKAETF